jgi:hypothetical protein
MVPRYPQDVFSNSEVYNFSVTVRRFPVNLVGWSGLRVKVRLPF